jgi:hypothetical protein
MRAVLEAPMIDPRKLMPVTDDMIGEVKRLSYEAIAQGAPLAVLPVVLLSLVTEIERLRADEQRAYTLLVSVQPAAHRQYAQSSNDTAERLHKMLEDAIQAWVEKYQDAHGIER